VRVVRLLLIVAVAYALLWAPAAAGTGPGKLAVLQFNMCGDACGTHFAVVNDLEKEIRQHPQQPFFVTLDEACRSQYDKLTADLSYRGYFATTIRDRCWDGTDYGVAVLVRSADVSLVGVWALPNPTEMEPRALACVRSSLDGEPLVGCVTHLDTDPKNTPSQVAAVARHASGIAGPVIVGGDFNALPANPAMRPLYDRFDEAGAPADAFTSGCSAAHCGTAAGYRHPTRKIDYVFLSRGDFTALGAVPTNAPHSDHTPLWATATLTPVPVARS
jgi:endonuclease/exonuclease/phosphatase family metal-dependent hydrolase